MKILNIIQTYPPAIGGAETYCKNIANFLAKRGIITEVATLDICNIAEAFHKDFQNEIPIAVGREDYKDGVFIKRYRLWRPWLNSYSSNIIHFLLYKLKLYKTQLGDIFRCSPHSFEMYIQLFRDIRKYDIVILHNLPYFHNIVGVLISKIYRKIVVLVPHYHPGHKQYERNIFYSLMNRCDAVIVISEFQKKALIDKNIGPEKIFVLPASIDVLDQERESNDFKRQLFKEYGVDTRSKCILFIGRKEAFKGVDILLQSAKELTYEVNDKIFLFLVGPNTKEFTEMFFKFYDTGRLQVIDFGVVSEYVKNCLLQISDVLVLCSQFEAFGIVFLEAWKYGKPVIGSDRGAIPSIIDGAGLCAEYGNIKDLKEKLKLLLYNKGLAKKLGETGRKKLLQNFTTEIVGEKFYKLLRNLKKQRRILIVSSLFPPHYVGGAELVAYEQAKVLQKTGYEVRIFAGKINGSERRFLRTKEKGKFKITRINLHYKDFEHTKYANLDKPELREYFREELYEYAPDIVHFHNISALCLKMIDDCHQLHIPTAMTLHDYCGICSTNILLNKNATLCDIKNRDCSKCIGNLLLEDGNYISPEEKNFLYLDYLNKVDVLLAPSKYLVDRYIEYGGASTNLKVIHNGIDASRFRNIKKRPSSKIRFGFIGQLFWHKGVDNLLYGFSLLEEAERNKISLSIVGSGDENYSHHCRMLAKDMSFVKFLGSVENNKIGEVLNNIDVLIVASIWPENSPVTIMEAFGSGTVVIAPDIGGIPEFIEDGRDGFLYKYDDVFSLVEKIRYIIKSPQFITEIGKASLEKARMYSVNRQVEMIVSYYDKFLDEHKVVEKDFKIQTYSHQQDIFRVPIFPAFFEIETTNSCNMNPPCIMCYRSWNGPVKETFISKEIICKLEPMFLNAKFVSLHGLGEPLMHASMLLSLIKSLSPYTFVTFNSNGVLLNRKNILELIKNKLNLINVSIDASSKETYGKIRRNDYFDIIKNNLLLLTSIKKDKSETLPELYINMTIMKENLQEVTDFVKLGKEVGASAVFFSLLNKIEKNHVIRNDGFLFDYGEQMINVSSLEFINTIKNAKKLSETLGIQFKTNMHEIRYLAYDNVIKVQGIPTIYFCQKPWESILVHTNGDVRICCFMDSDKDVLGNLMINDFDEIWNGEKIQRIRKEISQGILPKECKMCPLFKPRPMFEKYAADFKTVNRIINNGKIEYKLGIRNIGTETWKKEISSDERIRIGCRIYQQGISRYVSVSPVELRMELFCDVKSGEQLQAKFIIPKKELKTGIYKVKFDIVYEKGFWFEDVGSLPLVEDLEVL